MTASMQRQLLAAEPRPSTLPRRVAELRPCSSSALSFDKLQDSTGESKVWLPSSGATYLSRPSKSNNHNTFDLRIRSEKSTQLVSWLDSNLQKVRLLSKIIDEEFDEVPTERACDAAALILAMMATAGLARGTASASPDGGVVIAIMDGDKFADIVCLNDNTFFTAMSDRWQEEAWDFVMNYSSILETIQKIRKFLGKANEPTERQD